MALSEEVQDNLEKALLLTEDVEVKRSSVNAKKLRQKSAHRQAKKQTTTQPQRKYAIKQHQPEKSSTAGQKKSSISGGEDEMNIFNSLGLFDGKTDEGKQQKKSRRESKKHDKDRWTLNIYISFHTDFLPGLLFSPLSLGARYEQLSSYRDKSAAAV